MAQGTAENLGESATFAARVVRYADLQPCFNAFIDCRTPGSEAKENFTIIGPGVSENPAQHVHIAEPHGFNIGGARQPPHCVNSQHSHETAEVFVVHSGSWRFDLGEDGQDAQIELHPGDVISLPVKTFRGFTNIGKDTGFLWAILGSDDPGRVVWAPKVFELASQFGLVLLETGQLIDTAAGETLPGGAVPMPPTTPEIAATLRRMSPVEAEALVVRDRLPRGADRQALIGPQAPLDWPHGFTLERIDIAAGQGLDLPADSSAADVLFVHRGDLTVTAEDGALLLGEGDTLSLPAGLSRSAKSSAGATFFIARAMRD